MGVVGRKQESMYWTGDLRRDHGWRGWERDFEGVTVATSVLARAGGCYGIIVGFGGAAVSAVNEGDEAPPEVRPRRRDR